MYLRLGTFEFSFDRVRAFRGRSYVVALAPFGGALVVVSPRVFVQFVRMDERANLPDWIKCRIDPPRNTGGQS